MAKKLCQQEFNIKVNMSMELNVAMENSFGKILQHIKEKFKIIQFMAKESSFGQMEENMLENGKIIK